MRIAVSFLLVSLALCWTLRAVEEPRSTSRESAKVILYDVESQHPWNRLHRQLYTRTMQDGKVYDQEELEPPSFRRSRSLAEGDSPKQAIRLLDESLKAKADQR